MLAGRELVEGPDFKPLVLRHVEEPFKLSSETTSCKNVGGGALGGANGGGTQQASSTSGIEGASRAWTTGVSLQPSGSSEVVQFRRLQYRELTPEDYELLCLLDECVPNKNTASQERVTSLPRMQGCDVAVTECHICFGRLDPSSCVVPLPCGHVFHSECISKWLTQCKGTCPLCNSVLENQFLKPIAPPKQPQKEKNILELDALDSLELDAAAEEMEADAIAVTKLARTSIGRFGASSSIGKPSIIRPIAPAE